MVVKLRRVVGYFSKDLEMLALAARLQRSPKHPDRESTEAFIVKICLVCS